MAGKFPKTQENGKYDDLMTCKICHNHFDDPRLLPCSHTYCLRCIRAKVSPINGDFMCPMKDGTTIRRNQIDLLRKNDAMREVMVIESLRKLKTHDESSDDTDDTHSTVSECDIEERNVIYVSGLPLNMPPQELIGALYDTFSDCGSIKLYRQTNKPSIYLHRKTNHKTGTSCAANITFEKEESVEKAIRKHNGRVMPTLNNAKISVEKFEPKPKPKKSFTPNNAIYISGLPLDMPEQRLFDTLWDIFTKIDNIPINPQTSLPSIYLSRNKFNPTKLFGTATITFENEEAVEKAVRKCDGQVIQILNNAKISVKKFDRKPKTGAKPNDIGSTLIQIWIQDEGSRPIKKMLDESSTVGDLIKAVHNGDSYEASYGERKMNLSDHIPSATTPNKPITLRKIVGPQPIPNLTKVTEYTPVEYHIVVDNSNMFIGAQNVLNTETGKVETNLGIRINIANLVDKALEKGKLSTDITTRVVGGGSPQRGARIWKEWEDCGYKCIVGGQERGGREKFVDDMLHAQILKLLTIYQDTRKPQVLVLVTGDGNRNENQTSFRTVAEMVLKTKGWKVELWSWEQSLNPIYFSIQKIFPNTMTIIYLDPHRADITFVEQKKQN